MGHEPVYRGKVLFVTRPTTQTNQRLFILLHWSRTFTCDATVSDINMQDHWPGCCIWRDVDWERAAETINKTAWLQSRVKDEVKWGGLRKRQKEMVRRRRRRRKGRGCWANNGMNYEGHNLTKHVILMFLCLVPRQVFPHFLQMQRLIILKYKNAFNPSLYQCKMALISGAFITRLGPSPSLQRCESSLEGSWSVYFALMQVWQSNKHEAVWATRVAFISPSLAIRSKPFTKQRDLWHRKRKGVFLLFVSLRCSRRVGNSSSWRGNGKHRKTDILMRFVHKSKKGVHLRLCVFMAALWTRLLTADRGAGLKPPKAPETRARVAGTLLSNNKQQPSR